MLRINEALKLRNNYQIDQEIKERREQLDHLKGFLYCKVLISEINLLNKLRVSCESCRKNLGNHNIEIDDLGEFELCKECMDKGITFCLENTLTREQFNNWIKS